MWFWIDNNIETELTLPLFWCRLLSPVASEQSLPVGTPLTLAGGDTQCPHCWKGKSRSCPVSAVPPPSPLSWSPTVFLFSVLLLTICPVSLAWFISSSGQLCPNNARNCVVGHRGEVRSILAPWKLTVRVHPVFISISVSGQVSYRLVSYSVITGGYELNKCLNDF